MRKVLVLSLLLSSVAVAAPTVVVGELGKVDMKSLGGRSTGKSQLQEMSAGSSGVSGAAAVLRTTLPGIRDCHEAAIERGGTRGQAGIKVTLGIVNGGKVDKVTPETTGSVDETLKTCLVALYKPLRFQVPGGGAAEASYMVTMTAVSAR